MCGRLIAFTDFENGLAIREMHYGYNPYDLDVIELYKTLCKKHAKDSP